MPAGTFNFPIEQGTTHEQHFFLSISGAPVDITGWECRMQVRATIANPTVLASWNSLNGRLQVTDGPAGKWTLFLSDTDTAGISWTSGVYDMELIQPGATPFVRRILKGTITLDLEITR